MAQEDLDAKLDELLQGDDPQPAAPEAQPESVDAPPVKYADLDAVLPDSPDIDEDFRGKPIADVVRVAKQHKGEAGVAATRNGQWNQMVAERDAAKLALQYFQGQQQQQQAAAPQQQRETEEEYLQRLALRPQEVIGDQVRQEMDPIREELRQTREQMLRLRADGAQIAARDGLQIEPQLWQAISGPVSTFMAYNRWPLDDPNAWAEAARRYLDSARQIAQRFQPAPAQQQPTVDVPRAAAPANGTARSQSRPAATGHKVSPRLKTELAAIASAFGLDAKGIEALERSAAENPTGGLL